MTRSAWSNRSTEANFEALPGFFPGKASKFGTWLGDGGIVASVRAPDPGVDVVAALFPVASGWVVDDLDGTEPLARLVPVHGCHVEAHGAPVGVGDGMVLHRVRHQDVGPPGLSHRQRFCVGAVERLEAHA